MMQIYLPVAEISVNLIWLVVLGLSIGFLSGVFGVGGGFLSTPMLILIGIPPPIAVGSQAAQLVAIAVSGVIGHARRGNVDFKMGGVLLFGGVFGSAVGIWLFGYLQDVGQIDLAISLGFVVILGIISFLMLGEGLINSLLKREKASDVETRTSSGLTGLLPFKIHFQRSNIYMSALIPFTLGFFISILVSILGIGGGFLMVPAMIYLLKMPPSVVGGTSLFQIAFVTAIVTFLQAVNYQTVDFMLAAIMLIGGVSGVQFGVRISSKLKPAHSRLILACLVMIVCSRLAYGLIVTPDSLFVVQ
ncbi:MAG: sulfite exporter TauE/SafE family protein [Alphaproteobacteria bacterium]